VDGTYRLGSRRYRLPRHGFARGKRFDMIDSSARHATFLLKADAATLQVYPFQFELQVHFALADATLTVTTRVFNAGVGDMPASVGYHPAFRWPLPGGQKRSAHVIEFERDEPAGIRRLDSAGLVTAVRHRSPIVDRRLALDDALFQEDVIIWDQFNSRSVVYGSATGPRLKVTFPDAEYLGLWSKPGAEFVCIEPWRGIADPQGFTGDFTSKPGIALIAPGAPLETRFEVAIMAR
jgi:galactose mutarotase-like enzyme